MSVQSLKFLRDFKTFHGFQLRGMVVTPRESRPRMHVTTDGEAFGYVVNMGEIRRAMLERYPDFRASRDWPDNQGILVPHEDCELLPPQPEDKPL